MARRASCGSTRPCTYMSCSACWVRCWWMKSARAGGTSRSSGRSCGRSRLSFERAGDQVATDNVTHEASTFQLWKRRRQRPLRGQTGGSGSSSPSRAALTVGEWLPGIGFDKDLREEWCVGIVNLLSEPELRSDDVFCMQQAESLRFGLFAIFSCLW